MKLIRLPSHASLILALILSAVLPAARAAPGDVDPLDAAVVGSYVYASAVQPDGKTIIAGLFTSVLGQPRNNIARLNADGTLDAGFNPNANGEVSSVAVEADGRILLGGYFTTVGGTARNSIARVDAAGALDAGFNPNANGGVVSVAVQTDGRILLGGLFTSVGGIARNSIARVDAAGTLDAGFNPNADSFVLSVAVQADGRILLGGWFTSIGGTARNAIARVDAAGTLDAGFNPNANSQVRSVAVQADGQILFGGDFSSVGGTARHRIARVDAAGALDAGFNPNASSSVESVAVQADGRILLGGSFTTVGGIARNHIARVDAAGALDAGFNPNANNVVRSVAAQADGRILLGGEFTTVGGTARNLFARLLNDPATQTLSAPDATQITWTRGGSSPEISLVTFEKSTDSGATWAPLGIGTRIGGTSNWQLTGLSLTGTGQLRARGRATNGHFNGSSGLVESVVAFSFVVAPTVTMASVGALTATSATLNGTVNPNGDATTAQFEYGLTTSYGSTASVTLSPNNGTTAQNVSANLTGLTSGIVYHYRLTATNSAGTAVTTDATFTTISTNANLSNLTLSTGTLTPSFAAATTTYTASVPFSTTSLAVTPTKADANATITVNGSAVTSGSASGAISLIVGGNVITTVVTAQDGTTTKTYTTTVTRAAPGPGDLDVAFNVTGKVTTAFGGLNDNGYGVAAQSDGKVVVAGYTDANGTNDFALARYNADGSLDSSFGSGGKVVTLIGTDSDQARAVALQGDGKIVAAGYSLNAGNNDFAVVRYNTNGTLDTSFNGTGKVVTTFGTGNDTAQSVVVQSDGKIVAGGYFFNGSNFDFALARYNSNGTLDTSFNGTGKATLAFGGAGDTDQGAGLALQADGKILFTGYTYNGSVSVVALARYNTNGTLDTTFDGDGRVTTAIGTTSDSGSGVAVQSDGKIVVGCYTQNASPNYDFAVLRYTTTGALDAAFGTGGKVPTPVGSGDDSGYALALQTDGKILVVGPSVIGGNNDFGVVRYTTSGALDTTFNGTGKVTTAIGTGNDTAQSVVAAPDGSILVAGYTRTGSDYDFALVRYLGDPQLPILQTLAATSVTPSTATLNGTVNPNGLATTAQFEYGLTTSYGSTASVTLSPNNGSVAQNVNAALTGLTPGSTYHYRITASNSAGTANGSDLTFATPPAIPEIRVFAGVNDTAPELTDGQSAVLDFGSTPLGTPVARSFTVKNVGFADLHVSSLTLPAGYLYVGTAFPWTLVPNSTLTFQVRFLANSVHGTFAGAMTLANDDADEGPFDLSVTGAATFSGPVVQQWVQRYNGPANSNDSATATAVDSAGNVVVTGYSINASGNNDYYTAKYAAVGGALLWEKRYNGPANGDDYAFSVAVDSAGNVVVTGQSFNSGSFNDYYTAKYAAADGALLWEKRYNGPSNGGDSALSVAVDSAGNVVVTGSSNNAGSNDDYYTAKYAAIDGTLLWEKRYNGPANGNDSALSVAVDSAGNVAVTGSSNNAGGNDDYYTAKYAAIDGTLLWEKRYNGPANSIDQASSVAVDNAGNVIVTGQSFNSGSFNSDYYTAKYAAADGALLWEKRYNGPANSNDQANSVTVDSAGNVVVTGKSHNASGNDDYYTAKYAAADGALLWEKRFNGPANSTDQALSVAVDGAGNVVVTGQSHNGNDWDYYTAKYAAADGALLWEARYNGPANSQEYMDVGGAFRGKLALTSDGGAIITGQSFNGSNYDYATVRYGPSPSTPAAITSAATSVTATTATLNGTVNPNGILTSAWFEYGLTTSYGTSTTSQAQGYGTSASPVTAALTGLTPNTLYHYRLVAQNGETTAYGSDLTFTTAMTPQQSWRQLYFGTTANTGNAADSFDYDKDGLPNLLEWACNLNPTTASTLPVSTIRNGANFEFTYTRSLAALNAGAVFTVEWSDTLPGPNPWSTVGVTQNILSDNGTVQQVKAMVPVGSQGRRFAHLSVTAPP